MYKLYLNFIHFKRLPGEIMNLPKGERNLVLAFTEYAIEHGEIPVTVRNFSKKEDVENG